MKKQKADKILRGISPIMGKLGIEYAQTVPLDYLSKEVFLELQLQTSDLQTALQSHLGKMEVNEVVNLSQKKFIEVVNQFTNANLSYFGDENDELKISLCPVTA